MKEQKNNTRRNLLKGLGIGTMAGMLGMYPNAKAATEKEKPSYLNGLPPLKITNVKAIGLAPSGSNLIVIKVETSEPGLYGLGCATFTQRAFAVITAIEKYLKEFCVGKDVDNIEDMWQAAFVSSYWRNGPVLNNAISGLDQALWDIKGKRANMPVYQLLGGKCRFAIPCYTHASGNTPEEAANQVSSYMEEGYRYVRIQQGGYGGAGISGEPDFKKQGFARDTDQYMDQGKYRKDVPKLFETVRRQCGEEVELLHDIHERLDPIDAINVVKSVEPYHPFFIEDPFSPEQMEWFKQLRNATTVPLAMGELFNNINEFKEPMTNRLFDYIRIHISQIGGISPAMKVARLGEFYGIKTAWHGPGDVSPVGHAANAHIDLAIWNFGIQEAARISDLSREIFPGSPTMKDGYMWVNEVPGLGVDINEKLAAKYPMHTNSRWTVRKFDGTIIRP
ncbi:enolase C-terminal domain-like protein [Cyclobacterium marinum]|uniref:Mandelate racemase/muconate lactonizing protein n=1 Tax=Cyclobacterium marinum (strain ATCC 25205 / DSM 745 / LMG 13164 / NCIMB 1802) TaxID=880070 RepID=G0J4J7_CYCMS|nr:enolase C-terminal domain-like protein [Cyclobacterium marinum]AEL24662.1 Mandelate racemase/muconate lactonizing protein [Cyclobacterium marinum DSM 745]MBI0401843.1 starvation-sensing protein RspA [Cyclobacterium marinum]